MYEYKAILIRTLDGDTIVVDIDLGFNIYTKQTLRLAGINAFEKNTEQGQKSRERLIQLLQALEPIFTIKTFKDKKEKYGRLLVEIPFNGTTVNQIMVQEGHAVPYMVDKL